MAHDASSRDDRVAALVKIGVDASRAYGREDLAERLDSLHERIRNPAVQIVVVGEFKQGKSSLINALINAEVCPVDDDIATALPTVVRHGPALRAHVVGVATEVAEPVRETIDVTAVPDVVTERRDGTRELSGVEIEIDRRFLADGVVVIDTPGVGGLGAAHGTATLGALSLADAAIFVTDASQELTATEVEFLRRARERCPAMVCVLTKIDITANWSRTLERNRLHLERAGIAVEMIAASSLLRREAMRRRDPEMNEESGYPRLIHHLTTSVIAGARDRLQDRAVSDVVDVVDTFSTAFEAELAVLEDPRTAAAITERLEAEQAIAEERRGLAARWATALNDGIADLSSDVEHDFRVRVRRLVQQADETLDAADPGEIWAEFEPWLINQTSQEVLANYELLTRGTRDLSARVADLFGLEGADALRDIESSDVSQRLHQVELRSELGDSRRGGLDAGLTALRGGYGGVMMFTMLGSMVGVALGPLALGVGLVMGRKGIRDEKNRRIGQRRQQAKSAARKYCDEVSIQVTKDVRDMLRRIQRHLRDHYAQRADEVVRSLNDTLRAAKEAANTQTAQRPTRIADLRAELDRLERLRQRAEALR